MKILLLSMNSIHFRRWTSQLEDSGHEVFWFDALGAEGSIKELPWVTQKTDWRLRFKKGRYALKKVPGIKYINQCSIENAFEKYIKEIQPEIVHSFALQISVIPILEVMVQYPHIKWVGSTWGSDVFYFEKLGVTRKQFRKALSHINYLFTDCIRDAKIVKQNGFKGIHLGVIPGNGGIAYSIAAKDLKKPDCRKQLLIKAYDDGIGQGDVIIQSLLEMPPDLIKGYKLVFLGISNKGRALVNSLSKQIEVVIYPREQPIENSLVIKLLSESYIYIGNSLSDGIPNLLLEAMGNGAFPIQSNPGDVTREIIEDKKNGILIEDPLNYKEIEEHITRALVDTDMVLDCFYDNIEKIRSRSNRIMLQKKIIEAYEKIV